MSEHGTPEIASRCSICNPAFVPPPPLVPKPDDPCDCHAKCQTPTCKTRVVIALGAYCASCHRPWQAFA